MGALRVKLALAADGLRRELVAYRLAIRHPQTPWLARVLLGAAIGYALLPFDLIPDFIPLIGHLDDAIIVPALFLTAIWLMPPGLLQECRAQASVAARAA